MEVNLRKASALSKALIEASKRQPLGRTVSISIYETDGIDAKVAAAETALVKGLSAASGLLKAGYGVRAQISGANAACGINDLLNERALLDAQEKLLTPLVDGSAGGVDPAIAPAKLEALKVRAATDTRGYNISEDLAVSVAAKEQIAQATEELLAIRRRKTAIADDLMALNMVTKITLAKATVSYLEEFRLI